ncbi:MAG: thiamine pyrophosphate-dependent dehydrogenase E1 component subunit alpha [Chloroflexaceae bacterium]|nr:thiamine pyrophosphate-dependent dehydrogenase E1 component subunit alpha [Chloroflexaceae bacterium]
METPSTNHTSEQPTLPRHLQLGLSDEQVIAALCGMQRAREVDDRLWVLSRQGKAHFVITSAGHEAIQFGCGWAIRVGHDYVVPYYRDMALALALGQTSLDLLLHAMGKPTDPASGGRQMFGHFSSRKLRLVSGSSSVGSHIVHAVGLALAFRITGETDIASITFFGEGATSEGAWHEGISIAGVHQLPVVFVCENNSYAISVPLKKEVPVPDVATKAAGYGMPGVIVDGTDIFAVYETVRAAMKRARSGGGPTLVECKTHRLRPHSNSDDHTKYRPADEIAAMQEHDPIQRLLAYVVEHNLMTQEEWDAARQSIRQEVNEATTTADRVPDPPLESLFAHLYGTEEHDA